MAGAIRGFGSSRHWGLCMKRERGCGLQSLGVSLRRMRQRPFCNLWKRWAGGFTGW